MVTEFLKTPIEFLKGVGPERATVLRSELNIHTFYDLLTYYPFRYVDRTQFHNIADIFNEDPVQLKGHFIEWEEVGEKRSKRLRALFKDQTGVMELVWFKGIKWVKPKLRKDCAFIIYGKPSQYRGGWNIAHPDLEAINPSIPVEKGLEPVYHSTEKLSEKGLHTKGIAKIVQALLPQISGCVPDLLPADMIANLRLPSKESAFMAVHKPSSLEDSIRARNRIKFEELFLLQMQLIGSKMYNKRTVKGHVFDKVGDHFNTYYHKYLPFTLTNAQKRVIKEIRKDMATGKQMNRLVQGDVGSGKTMVAMLCMLLAIDNGFQAAIMAPTEILATQHFLSISEQLKPLGIQVRLLTGSTKKAEREDIHLNLQNGELHIIVGTHALLEEVVSFKNLGLAVIDEQHRFGVAQRARLWRKNTTPPHILVMTATPIPRTLAMTLYGDLDVSIIDELPPGRKPIETKWRSENHREAILGFMEKEIELGRQIYVVYPLIDESEKLDLVSLNDGYESMCRRFPMPKYRVSIVTGRMKAADKELEMKLFAEGKTQILVATTVIEVGVNVPNASVMIIENAERFGLSQLHQLRGRVGRGAEQSYCILMTGNKISEEGQARLKVMCSTNDGFIIAEEDLKLRGPGDIMGTQQSGVLELKMANLAVDGKILHVARQYAFNLLEEDPHLEKPVHQNLKITLNAMLKKKLQWTRIS